MLTTSLHLRLLTTPHSLTGTLFPLIKGSSFSSSLSWWYSVLICWSLTITLAIIFLWFTARLTAAVSTDPRVPGRPCNFALHQSRSVCWTSRACFSERNIPISSLLYLARAQAFYFALKISPLILWHFFWTVLNTPNSFTITATPLHKLAFFGPMANLSNKNSHYILKINVYASCIYNFGNQERILIEEYRSGNAVP